jgi:hypothetical protein
MALVFVHVGVWMARDVGLGRGCVVFLVDGGSGACVEWTWDGGNGNSGYHDE